MFDPPHNPARRGARLMKNFALRIAFGLVGIALLASAASADTLFMKALKAKYDYKIVSCYTCHAKGKDPATGEPFGKEVRNDFGKLFEPALAGKDIKGRIAEAKEADDAKKAEINEAITADFLAALATVEAMQAADGKTYAEHLKAGTQEGVKLKTPK
jgi:hypothetical protein